MLTLNSNTNPDILDVPASATQDDDFALVRLDSQMRISLLVESASWGKVKSALFQEQTRHHHTFSATETGDRFRVILAEDYQKYNQFSNDNYRNAYQGNPRSGELDRSIDWNDTNDFQYIYR